MEALEAWWLLGLQDSLGAAGWRSLGREKNQVTEGAHQSKPRKSWRTMGDEWLMRDLQTNKTKTWGHKVALADHGFNNPSLRRQKQTELCEFEASLVYTVSSRTDRNVL